MRISIDPVVLMFLCLSKSVYADTRSETRSTDNQRSGTVAISLLGTEIGQKILRLCYVAKNDSAHDIWLCDVISVGEADVETYWANENRTFVVRKRSNIEHWSVFRNPPLSRYIRLRAGESRTESLLLPLPLRLQGVVTSEIVPADVEYVERIAVEIGYYDEATSEVIRQTIVQEERGYKDEEFYVYHRQGPILQREGVLRLAIDGLRLRWAEGKMKQSVPNLTNCTRLEIHYRPSVVDYFFPSAGQQALLNSEEKDYLESDKMVSVTDQNSVTIFADEIKQGRYQTLTVEGGKARVVCFENDRQLVSLDVYHGAVVTDDNDLFYGGRSYVRSWPNLERITPKIEPFMSRVRCARNLQRLNWRLRFYDELESTYPVPGDWCDIIVRKWQTWSYVDDFIFAPFICPAANRGKCHYSMNPDCRHDSPSDVVLLFETKAGWNQHGGQELFTFDNHDPRGGLVLLNDGTVKFIRTEEELKQLRWK